MSKLIVALSAFVSTSLLLSAENRTISGVGNAVDDRGAAGQPFLRITRADYGDGHSMLAGPDRPSPRSISNLLSKQAIVETNARRGSDLIWQWGQFLDHDLTRVPAGSGEDASIRVPDREDVLFPIIPMERSNYLLSHHGIRQQINAITSFIDASNVYGSDPVTADALRAHLGGRLKTGPDGLLPFNEAGLPMDGIGLVPEEELRMAGDVRANEQPGLTALHTLFVHEHNRLAAEIASEHATWSDEQVYQRARKIVGALMQSITYNEWLPSLLGEGAPDPARFRYDASSDPSVSNEFAGALFRFGHSLVGPALMRIQKDSLPDAVARVSLADSFFDPSAMTSIYDYECYLKGLASQQHQPVDIRIIDELRNHLFGPAGSGGLDLAALNIQRGRDHGLEDYNAVRVAFGLNRITSWTKISSDPGVQLKLAYLYSRLDNIDLWVGALCEDPVPGSALGELMTVAIAAEFTRLAEGDAMFYHWDPDLEQELRNEITRTTLCEVICRNTGLTLQPDVFFVPEPAFKIENLVHRPGTGVEILFMADPGYEYRIKHGPVPGEITEDLLDAPLSTGSATYMMKALDPGSLRGSGRFYKIERRPVGR